FGTAFGMMCVNRSSCTRALASSAVSETSSITIGDCSILTRYLHELPTSSGTEIERCEGVRLSALDPLKSVSPFITVKLELIPLGVEEIDTLSDEMINGPGNRHVMGFQLSVTFL